MDHEREMNAQIHLGVRELLRTDTSYRISCLRVDRRCQIWPIRGYTRFWYTVMSIFKINFTGIPSSSSPVSPRSFPALSLAFFFACAPLSERLEQANRNGQDVSNIASSTFTSMKNT